MNRKNIFAVMAKQWMDAGTVKGIIFQFLFYPAVLLLLTLGGSERGEAVRVAMVSSLAPMLVGSSPMLTINSLIREDRSSGALRALMLASVRPGEYMVGVSFVLILISTGSSLLIGLAGGLSLAMLPWFILVMCLGSILTVLMGCAFSLRTGNQGNAVMLISIFSVLNGMIPILETVYPTLHAVTRFWYTQQIKDTIVRLYAGSVAGVWSGVAIIGANLALILAALVLAYRKTRLFEA